MNTENKDEVVYLYLDDIIPNRFQPREVFDERALKELAVSIKEHGVIQPIIVRSVKGKYEIIAGERRYKASALAGMTKIPAIIRNLDDKESSKVALLENLQRKNLTPIEEARTYQKILEIDEMTQEDLAKTMGKSQSAVANKLRLLSLPDEVQNALLKEQISERHARALLNIPNAAGQVEMLKKVIANKLSVRTVEEEIKRLYNPEEKDEGVINMNRMPGPLSIPAVGPINPNTSQTSTEFLQHSAPTNPIPPKAIPTPSTPVDKFASFDTVINDDFDSDDTEPPETYAPKNTIGSNPFLTNATNPKKDSPKSSVDLDNLLKIPSRPVPLEEPKDKTTDNGVDDIAEIKAPLPKESSKDETMPVNPNAVANPLLDTNLIPPKTIMPPAVYTTEGAKQRIKDVIADFKDKGVSISVEEMDFETSYQIIIKIDK